MLTNLMAMRCFPPYYLKCHLKLKKTALTIPIHFLRMLQMLTSFLENIGAGREVLNGTWIKSKTNKKTKTKANQFINNMVREKVWRMSITLTIFQNKSSNPETHNTVRLIWNAFLWILRGKKQKRWLKLEFCSQFVVAGLDY